MKKSIQLLMMSMFLSPLINAQVKDFVIEPPVKPNLYLYKSFGVFGVKNILPMLYILPLRKELSYLMSHGKRNNIKPLWTPYKSVITFL